MEGNLVFPQESRSSLRRKGTRTSRADVRLADLPGESESDLTVAAVGVKTERCSKRSVPAVARRLPFLSSHVLIDPCIVVIAIKAVGQSNFISQSIEI